MSDLGITYYFEGDEVFAIHEGKVIASGTDVEHAEGDAVAYLESLTQERDKKSQAETKKKATHVVTPNGVKGKLMGRVPSIYGEQITARFENGQITTFTVSSDSDVRWVDESSEKTASAGLVGRLSAELDKDYERDRQSLATRHDELLNISKEAVRLIRKGAPYLDEVTLDKLRTQADAEALEIRQAIDHLDSADAEAMTPPSFESHAVEQASLGRGANDDWLEVVAQEMVDETEAQDFQKLLREGPSLFVTELDNGALADAGVTREMALSHVVSKTAGYQGDDVDEFRMTFIARAEAARRNELAARKETIKKEAATEQDVLENVPDEALFS